MKGLLPAVAVLGVLAIGGLPVLALTLADNETSTGSAGRVVADGEPGPPTWAHGNAHGHDKGKRDKDGQESKGQDGAGPGWLTRGDQPPGWAKHHVGRSPHGWAMREWAHCLADAAGALGEGEKLDPERACGARPTSPGQRDR